MPRNMSFSATMDQVRAQTKTVTRRSAWVGLEPGTILCAVEKSQGIPKGGSVTRIAWIEVTDVRREPLWHIDQADCAAEGFPDLSPDEFVELYQRINGPGRAQEVTRIEFRYLTDAESEEFR